MISNQVRGQSKEITPQLVVEHVKKAVKLIEEKGPDIAFPILSNPEGEYVDGDLYVFTYDMEGTIIQHLRPKLVGKNMMNIKDKEGKCLACDFLRIAREEGQGWSQYWWPRPGSGKLSVKVSYIMKVPNHEMFVGVGVYDMKIEEVKSLMKSK
jgi:signal transduction histidine kinase